METLYCYITTGEWESRKGLIWGPFCPIYGVGAIILIVLLDKWKEHKIGLFIAGTVIGNIIEYSLSYIMEAMYGTRFWDYSYISNNLNGRICIMYSFYWGILAILVICGIKPLCDKVIEKISLSSRNKIAAIVLAFFIVDTIFTVWGIFTYENRIKNTIIGIEIENTNWFLQKKQDIEEVLFSNEYMSKTFPNLRYKDENGKEIWIRDYIK